MTERKGVAPLQGEQRVGGGAHHTSGLNSRRVARRFRGLGENICAGLRRAVRWHCAPQMTADFGRHVPVHRPCAQTDNERSRLTRMSLSEANNVAPLSARDRPGYDDQNEQSAATGQERYDGPSAAEEVDNNPRSATRYRHPADAPSG